MTKEQKRLTVFITTPLEAEHVNRIKEVAPNKIEIIYDPALLPPTRYIADHKGLEGFARTPEQEERWKAYLKRADVLWDFPPPAQDGRGGDEWLRVSLDGG